MCRGVTSEGSYTRTQGDISLSPPATPGPCSLAQVQPGPLHPPPSSVSDHRPPPSPLPVSPAEPLATSQNNALYTNGQWRGPSSCWRSTELRKGKDRGVGGQRALCRHAARPKTKLKTCLFYGRVHKSIKHQRPAVEPEPSCPAAV